MTLSVQCHEERLVEHSVWPTGIIPFATVETCRQMSCLIRDIVLVQGCLGTRVQDSGTSMFPHDFDLLWQFIHYYLPFFICVSCSV